MWHTLIPKRFLIYFIPYTTILGTKGKVSIDKLIEKKFLSVDDSIYGFYCGLSLANILGFTTQNPACCD